MMPGTGGTPSPPPGYRPPPLPGVAAGSVNIFRGRLVLVSGPAGAIVGVFVYQQGTTPALGNPPIFWATSSGLDPFGNVLSANVGVAGSGFFIAGDTVIAASGLFTYNGAPGVGNPPISAICAPGTTVDPFGNTVAALATFGSATGGRARFDATGFLTLTDSGNVNRILIDPENRVIEFYDASGTGVNAPLTSIAAAAGTDRFTAAAFPSGMYGQQLTLANQGSAPPAFANSSVFYSSLRGRPRYVSQAGDDSILERSLIDVTQYSNNNGAGFLRISGDLLYLANEGAQSSEYEIETFGNGHNATVGPQLWTYALFADGLNTGAQFSIGGAAFAANTPFDQYIRFVVSFQSSGIGGAAHIFGLGNLAANNANRSPSISIVGMANLDAWPIDTTVAHTFEIRANWGASVAGQAMTTFRSKIGRVSLWPRLPRLTPSSCTSGATLIWSACSGCVTSPRATLSTWPR